MDEPTYLGPTAAAELAALAKAELGKKAGKDIATAEADGLMSATDKVKLDGVEDGATKTIVDDAMSETSTNPVQNKVVMKYINSRGSLPPVSDKNDTMLIQVVHGAYALRTKESIFPVDDALDTESKNAVENCVIARRFEMLSEVTLPATSERDGLMSKDDKAKLDDVETGANKTVVDATLDAGSANPVQNKAVKDALDNKADKTALDNKADTTVATASANGLMSAADSDKEDTFKKIVGKIIKCGLLEREVLKSVGKGAYTYFRKTTLLKSIEYVTEAPTTKASVKKKAFKKKDQAEKVKVLDGQITVEEALEAQEPTDAENVANTNGCTIEKAEEILEYAVICNKNNPVGFAIKAIGLDM